MLELEVFQTEVIEKIKTQFIFNNFFPESPTVYEIMWMVQPDRPPMLRVSVT
jgi:hypothetical protein